MGLKKLNRGLYEQITEMSFVEVSGPLEGGI